MIGHRCRAPLPASMRTPLRANKTRANSSVNERPDPGSASAKCRHGVIGGRHEMATGHLGQRLDQGDGEFLTQAGHLPIEAGVLHLVEDGRGDVHRHPSAAAPGENW